jgi:crossover junction endodeoxyribonuclease RuvC
LIDTGNNKPVLMHMGVQRLAKFRDPFIRLGMIYERISNIIEEYKPHEVAIEAPFYGKNIQSMLKLGRAQGVALAAAITGGLPVFEYAPRKVKQSITGNGNASKEQVAMMVQQILRFRETSEFLDATDAVAVAICHYYQHSINTDKQTVNSWEEFIRKNPGRIH